MDNSDDIIQAAQLLVAREQWKVLLEADFYARMIVYHDGRIVMVNRMVEDLLDYPESMILGHLVEEFLPEELRERHVGFRTAYFENPTRRAMGSGPKLEVQTRYGRRIAVEIGLAPLRAKEGTFASITFK